MTLLDKVETPEGTDGAHKTRYLWIVPLARTSVMPSEASQLASCGIQFHWNTRKASDLEFLHRSLLGVLRDGMELSTLREIVDIGKPFVSSGIGLPLFASSGGLPDNLRADKQLHQPCALTFFDQGREKGGAGWRMASTAMRFSHLPMAKYQPPTALRFLLTASCLLPTPPPLPNRGGLH